MIRYCEICNKEFNVRPAVVKLGRGRFCSVSCRGKWLSIHNVGEDNPNYRAGTYINCKCLICGKDFLCRKWSIKNKGEGKYCSRKCQGIYRSTHYIGKNAANYKNASVERECKQCGKVFEILKSKVENGRGIFCSCKCQDTYKSIHWTGDQWGNWKGGPIEKECPICGKSFSVSKCRDKGGRGKICSKECLKKWLSQNYSGENSSKWLGGDRIYPAAWNEYLKEFIRDRDNHICQICYKPENGRKHDVHHIDYDKNNLSFSNLITLCNSCHTKTSANRDSWVQFFSFRRLQNAE